jgi:hypothetical protein
LLIQRSLNLLIPRPDHVEKAPSTIDGGKAGFEATEAKDIRGCLKPKVGFNVVLTHIFLVKEE